MIQSDINPYRPVDSPTADGEFDTEREVAFRLTRNRLRHAESHLLLRVHFRRLGFGSILLIVASGIIMFWSRSIGLTEYVIASASSIAISTLIYLGMVHRSKLRIRDQLQNYGLVQDVMCSLQVDTEQVTLTTPTGIHRWPRRTLKSYVAPGGLLLSPEPLLPIFVPKRNQSSQKAFDQLSKACNPIGWFNRPISSSAT